jgi:alcohol dehydrogenase class IV
MRRDIEVAREAREVAQSLNADCAIAIGGGSTIGLGKAIALESGLSVLAIPTTYAGSEMTPIYGITEGGLKRTGTDGRVLPKTVGMALHHKLCHTLGGSFNLPHAETHTIVLPHALAYNSVAAPDAMRCIARALGSSDAAQGVYDLARNNGTSMALKDLGMSESDLDRAADIASANPYWNPRPIDRTALRTTLQDAYDGVRPREARS